MSVYIIEGPGSPKMELENKNKFFTMQFENKLFKKNPVVQQ